MTATVRFCGGAGTVTGSKYLVEATGRRVLLDCGLFQGPKALRLRNWEDPPFDANTLDAVLLSHAHLDHCGYLPVLVRHGFRGEIFCTAATAELLRLTLLDSARIQEEDAEAANRAGYSKHHPALPLYTVGDVQRVMRRVVTRPYGQFVRVAEGINVRFRRAGHLLGSALLELSLEHALKPFRLVFSGDLGRWDQPILRDPEPVEAADALLLESTYGDRTHAPHPEEELANTVNEAVARGGVIIVPSFAIGRTQQVIWWLRLLERDGRIPTLPIFVDSPMATKASYAYDRFSEEHDAQMRQVIEAEGALKSAQLQFIETPEQSRALRRYDQPCMIISASGMATGGRVLDHLEAHLPDERATVILVGFQAEGTRGRLLQDGAKIVKIHGQDIRVQASIRTIEGLSAHADQQEILRWLSGFQQAPAQTYLVHGESTQAASLARAIHERFGWPVRVAQDGERVEFGL